MYCLCTRLSRLTMKENEQFSFIRMGPAAPIAPDSALVGFRPAMPNEQAHLPDRCKSIVPRDTSNAAQSSGAPGAALPTASIPFRQFHRDALRSGKKDQLSVMEVHDLVPELDAVGFKPCHLGL
jgi:hypothetical protein